MQIDGLHDVEVEEAKMVEVGMKTNINKLILSWNRSGPTGDDLLENEKMVLEALQPQANLGSLRIYSYHAKELPSWKREMTCYGGSPLSNLACSFGCY